MRRLITIVSLLVFSIQAFGQSSILQGGSWTPGHVPQYVSAGSIPVLADGGPAGGGLPGVNFSELGLTAIGTGTPPYAGQGTGPLGTNFCDYDAPTNNATGYHYLCLSANASGGGLVTYGAAGGAAILPLNFNINGITYNLSGSTIAIGSTFVQGGLTNQLLYDNAGILGGTTALPNGTTATTQGATDNSTNVATTAFVQTAITGLVYNVQDYGWLPDSTDHSTQALALLATVNAAGGGTIYFPAATGTYRADSQLLFPNDGASPQPHQKNIRLTGAGGGQIWAPDLFGTNAATLDLRFTATDGNAKIETRGLATLQIDNLTIKDGGTPNTTPLIHTTNTTLIVRNNTFVGSNNTSVSNLTTNNTTAAGNNTLHFASVPSWVVPGMLIFDPTTTPTVVIPWATVVVSKTASTVVMSANATHTGVGNGDTIVIAGGQDAIVLGGATANIDGAVDGAFQGYGSVIDSNNFALLNRGVYGRTFANSIVVTNNTWRGSSGAVAMEFDGSQSSNAGDFGETVTGNIIEMTSYLYGIALSDCSSSIFMNHFYDSVAGTVGFYALAPITNANPTYNSFILGQSKPFTVGQLFYDPNVVLPFNTVIGQGTGYQAFQVPYSQGLAASFNLPYSVGNSVAPNAPQDGDIWRDAASGIKFNTGKGGSAKSYLFTLGLAGTPTISSGACGAGSNGAVTSGNNQSGLIAIGSSTTTNCTVSWSSTWTPAPGSCLIFPNNSAAAATGTTLAMVTSVTTAGFNIGGSALQNANYYFQCL